MDTTLQITALVTVIVGLCEAIKFAIGDSRWIPLFAVVLGIVSAFYFDGVGFLSTAAGVILGLSTTGGYTVVKTSILNK